MSSKYRRGGLGRGLGALIPTAPPEDEASEQPPTDGSGRPMGYPPMPPYNSGTERPAADGQSVPDRNETASDPSADLEAAPTDAPTQHDSSEGDADRNDPSPTAEPDDGLVPVAGARFVEVDVAAIRPNPKQPRQVFDEDALAELTHSIREFGVLQPIVVRDAAADGGEPGYELVMGERRLRAAAAAGLVSVPAIVRTTTDDAMLRDALLENIHRAQLNPLEEAAAYQQLLEEFGATHDELAGRIGRSRPQVSNTIRLLNLPVPVQRRVAAGIISAGHARALLGLDDSDSQEDLAGRIVAEGLSVRATEELVSLHAQGHETRRKGRKPHNPRITAPALTELADRLSDAFDTRVKVELGRSKGKITVEFATIDDLERIVLVMSGHVSAQRGQRGQAPTDLGAGLSVEPGPAAGADAAAIEAAPARDDVDPRVTDGPAAAEDHAGDPAGDPAGDSTSDSTSDSTGSPTVQPAAEADPAAAEGVGTDYSGWGNDHVPDLGAWNDAVRYDPNES